MNEKIKASVVSGLMEVAVIHPIDYIKTLRQSNNNINLFNALKTPYVGVTSRLIGTLPMRSFFWISLDYFNNKKINPIYSGLYTSIIQTFLDYPIEVIKTQRIINNIDAKNSFKNLNHIPSYISHISRNSIFAMTTNYFIHKDKQSFYMAGLGAGVGAMITHPIDSLKTWYQSGNKKYPYHWKLYDYMRGYQYRCGMSIIGVNVGWITFHKLCRLQ